MKIYNIFVGNFYGAENVIIFNTTLEPKEIESILAMQEIEFSDVMEVEDEELQFYVYDPLFANIEWDERVRKNFPLVFNSLNEVK